MFGISAIFAFGQGFALLFVPKSPRFLIIKNKPIEVLDINSPLYYLSIVFAH